MERGMNKIVIITRKTRLQELIYKYNTVEQARFYIEHMGVDFSDYIEEDNNYRKAVDALMAVAKRYARVQEIDREYVPNMIFGREDIVIAIGQDGLVANVMKYLDTQALIGINPDTKRFDGVLLPFEVQQAEQIIQKVIAKRYNYKEITMAQAVSKDGQIMYAVNDLFIGCRTHCSARYEINVNNETENQSSSGIIVSTGLGSTGWYKSVIAQINQIARNFGGTGICEEPMGWGENRLAYVVREPYPSQTTQTGIVFGRISDNDRINVLSKMPDNGVIFSDGIENDYIEFNSGSEIEVKIADKKGMLVV